MKGRKYEIFLLSIKGYSSKEIAAKLYIVEATVNSHMKEILTILNVKARKELPSIIINKILELEKIE
ncbi:MAG: helix-turn-helix transcriptional regulator [Ignavibacteriales bacterium]|nr:helix-turn-helix transcriptional regulator [Ignavibacteriales bacterium]